MVFNLAVKESCFKHLKDIITVSVCYIAALLSHNQPRSQKALGNPFICLPVHFYFSSSKWQKPNNFVMVALVNVFRVQISKKNRFAKISKCSEKKSPSQTKDFLDLQIILLKMQRVVTKFCELIWLSFAN